MMKIDLNGQIELLDDDEKGFQDGVLVGSKITFQGSDLKVNAAVEGELERMDDQNQQTQNTVEHWDKFLKVRSIRVLLVETDDSTRHVVSALLRNCNYEVIDASNGREAWKILEDLTNHIDIVLTEIVLPSLSGIALLRKITSHKTRKNIPVIMMSSHDSMGLVFNCLSKGAVNFLVKPIRKNELKNFWQYVWRRHSSSGSGSESGTQTKKIVSEKADNSGSDDGENNVINGLNVGDGSDDGNGTQSSWTKQAVEVVEVDSSLSMSQNEHVGNCPDSTCAQVISPNSENSGHKEVDDVLAREAHGQNQTGTVAKSKDLENVTPKNVESKSENPMKILAGSKPKLLSDIDCGKSIKQVDKRQLTLIGEISVPLVDGKESGSAGEVSLDILDININYATDESKEANFELSIKRLRGFQESGGSVQDDRCVLPRYEQSAFSRYNASPNIFKAPDGTARSSSLTGNSVEAANNRSVSDAEIHSTEHLVYQSSNEASNNMDMGSTTNKSHACPSIVNKSQTTSKVNSLHSSAIRPMKNNLRYTQPQFSYNELSLKNLAVDAQQCGSTNVMSGPIDCNLQHCSLNRSASGSNHGSSTTVNGVGTRMKSDYGPARRSPNENDSRSGSGAGGDENRLTLREAAVIKFRQKRKDQTFKKKVRYQTRKKLAEQRPRVRGQFVKQTVMDSSNRRKDE